MKDFESKIRQGIIEQLDMMFENCADTDFRNFKHSENEITEEEAEEIESIFMAYRNVIAGTEWNGEKHEYETYEVK